MHLIDVLSYSYGILLYLSILHFRSQRLKSGSLPIPPGTNLIEPKVDQKEKRQAEIARQKQERDAEMESEAKRQKLVDDNFFKSSDSETASANPPTVDTAGVGLGDFPSTSDSDFGAGRTPKYNMLDIELVALVAHNFRASPGLVAAICSAMIVCLWSAGLLTPDNIDYLMVTTKKVYDAMERLRQKNLAERNIVAADINGIYFDGKSDHNVLTQKKVGNRTCVVNGGTQKHIVLVGQPHNTYLDHIVVTEKPTKQRKFAEIVCDLILKELDAIGAELLRIEVLGSDSEPTNTGPVGGVLRWIEYKKGNKVHWAVCLLHINELPFRKVFEVLDGGTTSGGEWKGPIGKLLPKAGTFKFNPNFQPIRAMKLKPISAEFRKSISKDLRTLYDVAMMIITGEKMENFEERSLGAMHGARWNNHCTRVGVLYVSDLTGVLSEEELDILRIITEYIVRVYVPMWFAITEQDDLSMGSAHYLELMRGLRLVDSRVAEVAKKRVVDNCYYFHPESLLLYLISSEDREDRKFAVDRIKDIRGAQLYGDKSFRERRNPTEDQINFNAEKVRDVLVSNSLYKHEPLLTCDTSTADLDKYIETAAIVPPWPCHTRAVEQSVQKLTKVCQSVSTKEKRDGYILTQSLGKKVLKDYRLKSDIQSLNSSSAQTMRYSECVGKKQ